MSAGFSKPNENHLDSFVNPRPAGKQIIGGFAYNTTSKLTITIYTNHVAIH
jgi:hypothetical protein